MSRKIFLKRSQTQMVPEEARVPNVIQVDEAFADQMTELTSLRSALLKQKFDKVSMTREQMLSENDGIGLIGSQEHSTACDERRACGGEIQKISSNYEQQHEPPEQLKLPSDHMMKQLESSPSTLNKQVRVDRKSRNATSESNVSEPETAHTIKVQQCNQRNNATKSDASVVLDNQQMVANREDKSKQTEAALRLKKRQVHLTRKSSEANTPKGRKKQSKTHSCAECGKGFDCKSKLTRHIMSHTGEKPFHCTNCNFAFSQRSHLTDHQMIHTGEKPFVCQICKKTFTRERNLIVHLWSHTGGKPFKCTDCGVAFSEKGSLTRHQRVHTDEKPFECDICSRSFRHKSTLSEHQNTHSDRRPYQCNVCKKTFRQRPGLSKHRRLHAKVEE